MCPRSHASGIGATGPRAASPLPTWRPPAGRRISRPAATSAARRPSSRPSPTCWSMPDTTRIPSGPNATDREARTDDERERRPNVSTNEGPEAAAVFRPDVGAGTFLDGNAMAGGPGGDLRGGRDGRLHGVHGVRQARAARRAAGVRRRTRAGRPVYRVRPCRPASRQHPDGRVARSQRDRIAADSRGRPAPRRAQQPRRADHPGSAPFRRGAADGNADVIVVGAGLAGLVAAAEAADAGRTVIVLDQEPAASLGGQAFWSLRRAVPGRHPRAAPARRQGLRRARAGRTGWARPGSTGPRTTGRGSGREAYVDFAAGEKRTWLQGAGHRAVPDRPAGPSAAATSAGGHGNSVPRFHVTWGTGPGVRRPVRPPGDRARPRRAGSELRFRHRVDRADRRRRGRHRGRAARSWSRPTAGRGAAVVRGRSSATSRCRRSGRDRDLRRDRRQSRPGAAATGRRGPARPRPSMLVRRARLTRRADARRSPSAAGGRVINRDRMWHYPEGVVNHSPGLDRRTASGSCPARRRCGWTRSAAGCPAPLFPGFDALGALRHITVDRPRPLLVPARPEDHRPGVRPVRLRAEPRLHRQVGASCC